MATGSFKSRGPGSTVDDAASQRNDSADPDQGGQAMPVIDQLRHEVPASTILAPLWASSGLEATDASVVDISDLTPQESLDVQDFAWVELPLLGGDGRITGVLCQRSGIAVPCVHAAH